MRTHGLARRALHAACLAAGASTLSIDTGSPSKNINLAGHVDDLSENLPSTWESGGVASDQRRVYGWKSVGSDSRDRVILTDGQGYRQIMRNFQETQFLTYFSLGGQTMAGILDTGSFELVVFSKGCSSCGQAAMYDPLLSYSHKSGKMFSGQFYGSGQTWSQDASDQMIIGPYKVEQSFWEVSKAKMPVLKESEFHAIIGLGPPETPAVDAWEAARKAAHNVSQTLATMGEVDEAVIQKAWEKAKVAVAMGQRSPMLKSIRENVFSVCIGKEPRADGIFVWNDTSVRLHPELFHTVPVIGRHSWSVQAHNARLGYIMKSFEDRSSRVEATGAEHLVFDNSTSIGLGCEDGCGILLDSGTSLLALPSSAINRLVQVISTSKFDCSNMWELPHLVFDMNGQTFSLPPDVYVTDVQSEVPNNLQSFVRVRKLGQGLRRDGNSTQGKCELLAMESYAKSPAGPLWIFGMPFFRKYYTSFEVGMGKNDSGRAVHFAGASSSCTPTKRRVEVHDGPGEMWKRIIDPTQLWMPLSVQLAATSDYVRL